MTFAVRPSHSVRVPAVSPDGNSALPLTGAQHGIVAACLVAPEATDFVVGDVLHITGLAADAGHVEPHIHIRTAILAVLAETPWLGFRVVGEGEKARLCPGPGVLLAEHDVRGSDATIADVLAQSATDADTALSPYDDVLTRIRYWVLSDDEIAISFIVHHVLLDGYSVHAVLRRIVQSYRFLLGSAPAPEPWTNPSAVVDEESQYRGSDRYVRDRDHWSVRAPDDGATHSFGLSRVTADADHSHATVSRHLDVSAAELPHDRNATFVDVFTSAHAITLARWTGAPEVVIGFPLMNRMGSAASSAPTCTVNVLPLTVRVSGHTKADELIAQVAGSLRDLRRHSRFRSEELMTLHGHLAAGTQPTGTELNVKLFDTPPLIDGAEMTIITIAEGPIVDVSISVVPVRNGFRLDLRAPHGTLVSELRAVGEMFADSVEQLLAHLDHHVRGAHDFARSVSIDKDTNNSDSDTNTEHQAALGSTARPALLHERLTAAAVSAPDEPALIHHERVWSHADLASRLSARSAFIVRETVPDQIIVIDLPRTLETLAWQLAAVALGRPAVVIDTAWPTARTAAIVAHLTRTARAAGHPDPITLDERAVTALDVDQPAEVSAADRDAFATLGPTNGAYIIHTSGSTGTPKPVIINQLGLARHLESYGNHMWGSPLPGDSTAFKRHRAALTLPLVFDGSWDMLSALTWGHCVVLIDHTVAQDPAACVAEIAERRATAIDSTPTIVAALLDDGLLDDEHSLTQINVGGEACPPELWERLSRAQTAHGDPIRAQNYYGPTESTVDATRLTSTSPTDAASIVDATRYTGRSVIGRAVEGTSAYVLDTWLQPLPYGAPGELYLAGEQLATGYLGMAAKTAERFVANPFGSPGERMYRTGDTVRMLESGHIVFEGRGDEQLKVRGYRIEPREIEAALESIPRVKQALVRADGSRLLAWVVLESDGVEAAVDAANQHVRLVATREDAAAVGAPTPTDQPEAESVGEVLRSDAAKLLAPHMVPAVITTVARFPITPTGKIDARALPRPAESATGRPAATKDEIAVAEAFSSTLDVARPGAAADFFRLGGDSIRAIALVARLRERGLTTSVSAIFVERTVEQIARTISHAAPARPEPVSHAIPADPSAVAAVEALLGARRTRPHRTTRA